MAANAAALLNIPSDQPSWDRWGFQLSQNLDDINQAILAQKKVALPQYVLYPIPYPAMNEWLQRVGLAMSAMAAQLRTPSFDVENVDLQDDRAKQAWVWTCFQMIRDARAQLKI